ncbi:MAG: AmmeMemoRadiSam system radical SAM enzyme [Nanoarchaeota archaeon]|nr:AmmeMemoRadiSam system radical SAM enzyme [Nanoarchaeota archaeon]
MQEAMFYEKGDSVKCVLCPHKCRILEGHAGICGVRKNVSGTLFSLVYGKAAALHIDPVEKKPLFHFLPGSKILSIGTVGCNLKCSFCQNYAISQEHEVQGDIISPMHAVDMALKNGCDSIALTYNEPTIFFEYALDICIEAKKKGLKTVFVSNGYILEEPIKALKGNLDAINIDLKSFSNDFYKTVCKARLSPVLEAIRAYKEAGVWVEITTLVIPGQNDSLEELGSIAEFIASIDRQMPWHVTGFHPDYNMQEVPQTSLSSLQAAQKIGKEKGLKFVYAGNLISKDGENTYCPACKKLLFRRSGFSVLERVEEGKCECGYNLPGIFG